MLGGVDLSGYDLDAPMPEIESNAARVSTPLNYVRLAKRDNLTLRQVATRSGAAKDHWTLIGTPRADRRRARALVRRESRRRLQPPAAARARRPQRVRRPRGPRTAAPRPLSHRIRRRHAAPEPRRAVSAVRCDLSVIQPDQNCRTGGGELPLPWGEPNRNCCTGGGELSPWGEGWGEGIRSSRSRTPSPAALRAATSPTGEVNGASGAIQSCLVKL